MSRGEVLAQVCVEVRREVRDATQSMPVSMIPTSTSWFPGLHGVRLVDGGVDHLHVPLEAGERLGVRRVDRRPRTFAATATRPRRPVGVVAFLASAGSREPDDPVPRRPRRAGCSSANVGGEVGVARFGPSPDRSPRSRPRPSRPGSAIAARASVGRRAVLIQDDVLTYLPVTAGLAGTAARSPPATSATTAAMTMRFRMGTPFLRLRRYPPSHPSNASTGFRFLRVDVTLRRLDGLKG